MSRPNPGVVDACEIRFASGSTCPPPGRYLSISIGTDDATARAFLTEAQAAALGRWLLPPAPPEPRVCPATGRRRKAYRSATSFPAAAIESEPGEAGEVERGDRVLRAKSGATVGDRPIPHPSSADGVPTVSGDQLVTGRFITGLRERHAPLSTAELERELATFEPDLARAAGRLIRATVSGHLGPHLADRPTREALADACLREVLVLLMALRGAYGDLLASLMPGDASGEAA